MGQFITGLLFIIFGIFIGGIGLATAGIGIGIPMIPIGIYLVIRGVRDWSHEENQKTQEIHKKKEKFESTGIGQFLFGILVIFVGLATSALIIGIPIIFIGIYLILKSFGTFDD